MIKTNYQNQLWTIVILLFSFSNGIAQCLTEWSFKNVTDIPTTCGTPWSEAGQTMQMIPTTAANSCNSGAGCVFFITENDPNQYNYLSILSGEFRLNMTNTGNLYTLRFGIIEGANACQTVRYYNGGSVVLEETVNFNYYQTDPVTTAGITFDQIGVAVINSGLYNFELIESCNDGAPAGGQNIGWEEFPQGSFNGTGSTGPLLTSQGVDIYVSNEAGEMLPPSTGSYNIAHTLPSVFGYEENFLFPFHPIKFDFSVLPNDVVSVYFDTQNTNLDVILKINDEDPFIGQIESAPTNIAPGFTLTDLGPLGRTSGNRYLIEGPGISSLVLGGLEFFLDNVSFVQGQASVCSIGNFALQDVVCNADQTFNLSFSMNVIDAPGNTFSYFIDNQLIGQEDLNPSNAYSLTNLMATNGEEHLFTVVMDGDPNCTADFNFFLADCANQSCIVFEGNLEYGDQYGNSPGDTVSLLSNDGILATVENYYNADSTIVDFQRLRTDALDDLENPENINLNLDFSAVNGTVNSLSFEVILGCCVHFGLNNEYHFLVDFNNLPSILPSDFTYFQSGNQWTISGPEITQFSFGGGNIFIGNFCYTIADPMCTMNNPMVEILDCANPQEYYVEFDFDYTGNMDSFYVLSGNTNFGNFAYADLPVTLGPFLGDGTSTYDLYAADILDICAIDSEVFGEINCDPPCELSNGSFVIEENCDPNGLVSVTIDFDHVNTSDSFNLVQNGLDIGNFAYSQLPLTLDGFDGTNQTINFATAFDLDDSSCGLEIMIGLIDCSFVCGINEFWASNQTCNIDGTINFELLLIFPTFPTQPDSFELFLNGSSIGSYATNNDFAYTIENITLVPGTQNLLTACNLTGPQCCQTTWFTAIDCPPSCSMNNPSVEVLNCVDTEEFYVEFDFDYIGNTDSFYVLSGNSNLGNFAYVDLPIVVGPFLGDGSSVYDLYAADFSDQCGIDSPTFGEVDCDPCVPGTFVLLENFCDDLGTFIYFNYNSNGPTGSMVYSLNGITIDTLLLVHNNGTSVETRIPIDANYQEFNNLVEAWVLGSPDCVATMSFDLNPCNYCDINSLEIEVGACDNNQTFDIEIFLNAEPISTPYNLTVNGIFQGQYSDSEFPITLNGDYGNQIVEVEVVNTANPLCSATASYQSIDCSTICQLTNPTFTLSDCDPFARFSAEIDFDYGNLTGGFVVYQNGIFVGNYDYEDLPITRQGFEGNGVTDHQVVIQHASNANCTLTIDIGIVSCNIQCALLEFFVFNQTCNQDGTANITFSMIPVNTNSTSFEASLNGEDLGIFQVSADYYYTAENVTLIANGENELNVCMIDGPTCCETTVFDGIECTASNCEIFDLIVEANDCNADGFFSVDLDFIHSNTSDSFNLVGNGLNYGNFSYSDLPITIDGFSGDGTTTYEFAVLDLEDDTCTNDIGFGPISCPTANCEISNLIVAEQSCDGIPYGVISFETANPGNDFWEYWINGEYQGLHELNATNAYWVPLEGADPFIDNLLELCINDQPNCCTSTFFEVPDCNECLISDLEVVIGDCSADGIFPVNLNFISENTSDSFQLVGNGENYGNFAYSDLPVTVNGFFIGNGTSEYELIATDLENNDCQNFVEFGPVNCGNSNCEISELFLTNFECDGDVLFANLFFEVDSPGNNFFDYWINGELIGTLELNSTNNYSLNLATADPTALNTLQVCINDNPDCCSSTTFEAIDCNPIDCLIENLSASGTDCYPDGTSGVNISFEYDYPPNESFEVYLENELIGIYNYAQLPLTVLHIDSPTNGGVIQVNPVGLPDCALIAMVGLGDCEETYCMDFNTLPVDLSYNSGNVGALPIELFEQENVIVSLDDCGSNDFFAAEVRNPAICQTVPYGDNAFYVESAALHYDFSNLMDLPNSLNFEYCGEGTITLNDSTIIDFGNDQAGVIITQNGFTVQSWIITTTPTHGYVTISGEVSDLLICGTETTLGPVCYDVISGPSGDQCYGFENLIDGGFYPIGSVDPLIYNSDGFEVTLEDGYYTNGFLGISSTPVAPPFNGSISNYAILRGGLNFDFGNVTEPIEFFSFDFSGDAFELTVNGNTVEFDGFNPLDSLISVGNGVVLYYSRENSNNWEGSVSIFGNVQSLLIVSEEIKLDNFCYFVNIQNSEVWPGDINSDNIADHCDILYLGIASGTEGPERSFQTDNWSGQIANDWDEAFEFQSTNFKHADANGDGIINDADVEVLAINLGKVHGPLPVWNGTMGTAEDPPLYVDLNANGPLIAGEAFSVPIMLGTSDIPVQDIYGLAFSIVFDSEDLDLSNTSLLINDSWLGSDLWKVEKVNQTDGRIDIGLTRTGLQDTTGFGAIGSFTGIIEDLVGKIIEVDIENIKALSHDESEVLIFAQGTEGTVTTGTEKDELEDGLHIFPIPTEQWLHVRNFNEEAIKLIKIYNVLGQMMLVDDTPQAINRYDLDRLVSGVYFIELEFNGHTLIRKIEVFD